MLLAAVIGIVNVIITDLKHTNEFSLTGRQVQVVSLLCVTQIYYAIQALLQQHVMLTNVEVSYNINVL